MFNGAVLLGSWRIYESDSDGYEGRIRLYNSFVPVPKPVCAMVCTFSAIVWVSLEPDVEDAELNLLLSLERYETKATTSSLGPAMIAGALFMALRLRRPV